MTSRSSTPRTFFESQDSAPKCHVCDAPTDLAGHKVGKLNGRDYEIRHCPHCRFTFVANPWLDYERIYDEAYYRGQGVDRLTDYVGEIERWTDTIRRYEWRGILDWARSLTTVDEATRWLDYGCGAGGLVRYLNEQGLSSARGFEQGWSRHLLIEQDVPHLDEAGLLESEGSFDVVTMIEVIEHVVDPVAELETVRRLLRPGGVLLMTTGNALPYRKDIVRWRYLLPDIHLSLFEPTTLALALSRAGFDVAEPGFVAGWRDIIHFKILKTLHVQTSNTLEAMLPWRSIARIADRIWGFSAHPVGVAPSNR